MTAAIQLLGWAVVGFALGMLAMMGAVWRRLTTAEKALAEARDVVRSLAQFCNVLAVAMKDAQEGGDGAVK